MLADASILNKLSPFFAILFSFILLKEKIHPFAAGCVFIAFVGSLFIIKPGFASVTTLACLCWPFRWDGSRNRLYLCTEARNKRSKRTVYRPFFSAFSCIVTLPYLIFDFHPMTLAQLGCLLLAGLFAKREASSAYTCAPAGEISIYDYSRLSSPPSLDFCFLDRFRTCGVLLRYKLSSPLLLRCSCSTERECSLSFFVVPLRDFSFLVNIKNIPDNEDYNHCDNGLCCSCKSLLDGQTKRKR